jgi:hypothetical protein
MKQLSFRWIAAAVFTAGMAVQAPASAANSKDRRDAGYRQELSAGS